jgi:hypothetical protein
MSSPPEFRGLFGPHGDSEDWLETVRRLPDSPNGVPRFQTKGKALEFVEDYVTHHGGSNPDHPHLQHIFTMLVGWEQIESILLPAIAKARKEPSFAPKVPRTYGKEPNQSTDNIYEREETSEVMRTVAERLDFPIHKCTTPASTLNTLKYLFFHMKCGIFVMIRNGQLRIFAPFVNVDYKNTWSDHLRIEGDGSLETYYTQKVGLTREEKIEPDKSKWWANGNIICNELSKFDDKSKAQHWGDHFLAPLRDMLCEACRERKVRPRHGGGSETCLLLCISRRSLTFFASFFFRRCQIVNSFSTSVIIRSSK